ncbi:MAG TPA: hypothetical protein PK975_07735 [Candidatus Hydrogenedentes bacterium]|nr:hypothetical protein [Candidatus Hydrogenedentota bacterium]
MLLVFPVLLHVLLSGSSDPPGAGFSNIRICLGDDATPVEKNVADLLRERIVEASSVDVHVAPISELSEIRETDLAIYLGIPDHHTEIAKLLETKRVKPLDERDPGPEGFLILVDPGMGRNRVVAAGVDLRGVLYAAGELLRRMTFGEWKVRIPSSLHVRTAPAFEIRGTQFGQSGVALTKAKVRPWTKEETKRDIMDSALAGANTFEVSTLPRDDALYVYIKSFDLKTLVHYCPNAGDGPPEWQAKESIGRTGYLCPSVPAAREALLKKCEEHFRASIPYDYVRFVGGDGGGCECDACDPYGKTYIHLCEDMAEIVHRYIPDAQIFVTNQKFDNDDDIAIFQYLQEKPRPWLRAFCYGPGSDAMSWQPGHRQTHRMDLFRYPGFGPFDRYLKEILHQLPPQQDIVFFNEVTHWRYSQYGYVQMYPRADRNGDQPPHWNHFIYERRPDQYLTMVYDRLTFYAWPRYYRWVFGETLRYGIGDVTHSSGTHDHFNQWMWQRLLWAPQTSIEDVVMEYCKTWFGPDAAPLMAQAIFQLEENLEEKPDCPLPQKDGIDRYYALVKEAGLKIPDHLMKRNWLWREFMQKAALDKYIQLAVRRQLALQKRIESRVQEVLDSGGYDEGIEGMLPWFEQPYEDGSMKALREEAGRLGDESNDLYGVRSEGYYNLLDHDFVGLGWLKRQLERARAADSETKKRELLRMIVAYEDPGEGGFYDNCGTFNPAPHVVFGYPYDHGQPYVQGMLSEGNRPSQRSMHYTQNEEQGVTFQYRGLDPNASYRVRFTFVRPWFQERYAGRMNQKSQSIYADDFLLAKDVELPLQMSDFFEYDIPREATQDGELTIRLEKSAGVAEGSRVDVEIWRNCGGWGTLVSEVWLMKKEAGHAP